MNTFFAVAVGGVMLVLVGRSLFKVYKIAQAEVGANDRCVALAILIATGVAFLALVLMLQSARS